MEINKIYDRMELCMRMDYPSFTEFLDLAQLIEIRQALKVPKGYFMMEFCGFADDERRMVGFFPDSYLTMMSLKECFDLYPVQLLEVEPILQHEDMFGHGDLLGSVLGLGLERKLFGDIIVEEDKAYILCHERGAEIVINELGHVGHRTVSVKSVEVTEATRQLCPSAKELNITIASLRLDGLVKAIGNCSRTEAGSMISSGLVKVNQLEVSKNHKQIEEGDILSIRRKGKFKIKEIGKVTRKGRIAMTILKYI